MEIFSQIDFLLLIVLAGALAGILAGLLGVGGGIVIVPLLYYILNILDYNQAIIMHVAVGTSLFIIIPTSIRSSVEHRVRGSFDEHVFRLWSISIIIGAALGSLLAIYYSFKLLTFLFAVIASLVSIQMFFSDSDRKIEIPKSIFRASPFFIGLVSAMMGIGGGSLSVPIMNYSGIDMKKAVGTSAAFGFLIAVPASIGFMLGGYKMAAMLPPFSIGYVNWMAFLLIVPITLMTVPIGVKMAHKSSQKGLKMLFALFLGITAIRMFSDLI